MGTPSEPTPHPLVVVREQMDRRASEFAAALPAHIPVERFKRVLMTAIQNNPDLLNADRQSLWNSAMRSAQDGLLPDGREGAIVIYNTKEKRDGREVWIKKAQWMPMVFGVLKKIRNSGEVAMITARVVYGGDQFRYWIDEAGEHVFYEPADEPDTNVVRRVFAMAKTKDGELYVEPLTPKDIEKIRAVSRAKDKGPWVDWWEEMAKKSAIRRLAKRLPMSTDLDDLVRRDDELYDLEGARDEARSETRRPSLSSMLDQIATRPQDEAPAAGVAEEVPEAAPEILGETLDDEIPDFEAMIARFEAAAAKVKTRDELEAAGAELLPHMDADRLGRGLRTRVENAWTDAEKRIAHGPAKKPAGKRPEPVPQDEGDELERVDLSDADTQRGWNDAREGLKKCIVTEIKDDETRFEKWKRGYDAWHAQNEKAGS